MSAYTGYSGPDVVSMAMLTKLHETVNLYSQLETKLAAADGDRSAALKSWIDSTDNAAAVKLRQQIESANAKLNELAEKNVESVTLTEEDKAKANTELDALKPKIKAAFNVIENLIENMSDDPEGVRNALNAISNPVKSTRGRKAGSSGSKLPRVSATVTVNGGALENQVYDSFSKVASVFKCDVEDIQKAFAEAAGVSHEDIKTVTDSVTFEFQPNSNGSVYTMTTTPKTRAPRGSKNAESNGNPENPTEQAIQTEESKENAA